MKTMLLAGAAAMLACALGAPADAAVRYDFTALTSFDSGPGFGNISGSFSYIAPDFLTADTIVPAGSLESCTVTSTAGPATCWQQEFAFDTVYFGVSAPGGEGQFFYYFPLGAFGAVGAYDTFIHPEQVGTLVVSRVADGPGVPEPSAWAMLILGFGAAGSLIRRRRALAA